MRLFPRLLIIFLTLILIPLGFVGTLVYTNAKIHIQNSMIHSLEAIADFRKGTIEAFGSEQRRELKSLQSHWIIQSKLPILIRHIKRKDLLPYAEAVKVLDQHFSQFKEHHGHLDIVMFDTAGRLVYANTERWQGLIGLKPERRLRHFFKMGKSALFFGPVLKSSGHAPSLWASMPIKRGGRLLGVLAMQVDISELVSKLNSRRGLGETGEILAGMMDGEEVMLINELRHKQGILSFPLDMKLPLVKAIEGESNSAIALDYRGHRVIAVWQHVPSMNWGMVVKIDVNEALHTVFELRRITLMIGLIATLFGALMAWVMARPLANDVQQLIQGAKAIGGGNLNYRLAMPHEGEFSDLATSFNTMAADMKKAIDERDSIMAELAASEERFRTMVSSLTGVVYSCVHDKYRSAEFVSSGIEAITGYPISDFLNGSQGMARMIYPKDAERVRQTVMQAMQESVPYSLEYRVVDAENQIHWVLDRGQVVVSDNRPVLLNGVMVDISGQKQAEQELRDSYRKLKQTQDASFNIMEDLEIERDALHRALEEREVLLREIHHRVKNNMQIISAMLELQAGYTSDSQVQEFFKDSQARIKSMALVHEKLYRLESLSRIDFGEYLKDLVDSVMLQYPEVLDQSAISIDVENIMMPIDKAIPCGLIVNELVSNIFKHAFPDKRRGEIAISMREDENNAIILTVEDNGVGLPKDLDIQSGKTFGMYIVHSLVERQLGGSMEIGNHKGASFVIRFNKEDKDG